MLVLFTELGKTERVISFKSASVRSQSGKQNHHECYKMKSLL